MPMIWFFFSCNSYSTVAALGIAANRLPYCRPLPLLSPFTELG
jgi:hypothetical protein